MSKANKQMLTTIAIGAATLFIGNVLFNVYGAKATAQVRKVTG